MAPASTSTPATMTWMPGSGELSIFAWVRTTQTGGLKMIVAQRDSSSSTNPGYQLFQNSNNALSYIIGDPNGSVVRQDSTGPQINDGNWHFVGVVFNRNATPHRSALRRWPTRNQRDGRHNQRHGH